MPRLAARSKSVCRSLTVATSVAPAGTRAKSNFSFHLNEFVCAQGEGRDQAQQNKAADVNPPKRAEE
jgi:hypothetical protein